MPIALQVRGLVKRYGARTLLDDATVVIDGRWKVGIVGRNGAGKSTFCRILLGLEDADSGDILRADGLRVGFLEQQDPWKPDETVIGFLERHTGREEWKCGETAGKLGLRDAALESRIGALPGGWRTRVKLAAMLLAEPDFLVLDEPTNFLDLATQLLVEDLLREFRGGALVVSHDREFLIDTCDHTLEIERGRFTLFPGDVQAYLAWKEEQVDLARRTNATIEAKREQLQAFVDRFRAKASKATQAQSKMKQIARLHTVEIARPLATVHVPIPQVESRNGLALAAEEVSIGYPGRVVAEGITLHVDRGERIAIVGDNGQGKTTLLRTLAGDIEPLAGRVRRTIGLEVAYYAQHVYEALHPKDTVRTHLESCAAKGVTRQQVLDMAGAFLFSGDDAAKPVPVLSGGERARLCLAGLLLQRRPILLLDEPTNHLDMETVEAMADALARFAGTVVFISHDRTFVHRVATQVVEVHEGRARRVPGTYADYVESVERRAVASRDAPTPVSVHGKRPATEPRADAQPAPKQTPASAERPTTSGPAAGAAQAAAPSATPKPEAAPPDTSPAAVADRRRRRNERDRHARTLLAVEKRIEGFETERRELHAKIEASAGTYDAAVYARLAEIEKDLAYAEAEWLDLSQKIQELS